MSIINFYNIDCMEFMATKPDKYYDLAICDVNYGINCGNVYSEEKKHHGNSMALRSGYKISWDNEAPPSEYFDLLQRKSKNQILWGANHFIDNIPFNKSSSCWIVWDKINGNNDFADGELAWTSFKSSVRIFRYMWNGMLQQNMKDKETRIHPTQKPVALYEWLLSNYAKPNDKIFDSHGGSMSSAIACDILGFDLDICELDKDYFDAGVKRFNQYKSQLTLF